MVAYELGFQRKILYYFNQLQGIEIRPFWSRTHFNDHSIAIFNIIYIFVCGPFKAMATWRRKSLLTLTETYGAVT